MKKIALIFALLLISCSDYERENFRMEVGKKYALTKWPDSIYIDTLDKFFENEYVRPSRKQKAEITMAQREIARPSEIKEQAKKQTQPKKEVLQKEASSTKSFAEQFLYALGKLLENPNNMEFGKKYKAKGGENLDNMLLRIYGPEIKKVPRFVSESMIKQLNPGIDASSFAEGDMVLLPVFKF